MSPPTTQSQKRKEVPKRKLTKMHWVYERKVLEGHMPISKKEKKGGTFVMETIKEELSRPKEYSQDQSPTHPSSPPSSTEPLPSAFAPLPPPISSPLVVEIYVHLSSTTPATSMILVKSSSFATSSPFSSYFPHPHHTFSTFPPTLPFVPPFVASLPETFVAIFEEYA